MYMLIPLLCINSSYNPHVQPAVLHKFNFCCPASVLISFTYSPSFAAVGQNRSCWKSCEF